jgi:hypothetical protein
VSAATLQKQLARLIQRPKLTQVSAEMFRPYPVGSSYGAKSFSRLRARSGELELRFCSVIVYLRSADKSQARLQSAWL